MIPAPPEWREAQLPPESALLLDVTLERNWERAYGYDGSARWLAVYYQSTEASWEDGQGGMCGASWRLYSRLMGDIQPHLAQALNIPITELFFSDKYDFGSDETDPTYVLLLDLQERKIYVAPKREAEIELRFQWPRPEPINLTDEEWEAVKEQIMLNAQLAGPLNFTFDLCPARCMDGWVQQAADGGWEKCPTCNGEGVINVRQVEISEEPDTDDPDHQDFDYPPAQQIWHEDPDDEVPF